MATVKYIIRGKEDPVTIYLRFIHGRKHDYTKSTGKIVNLSNCILSGSGKKSPILEGVKRNSPEMKNLNRRLRDLKNQIIDRYDEATPDMISGEWLQKQIDTFNGKSCPGEETKSDLLVDAIQSVIDTAGMRENSKGGLGLSKNRVDSYNNLLKIIKSYEGNKNLKVQDVNIKFGKDFLEWMLKKRNYSESYAKKKIDDLKTVCADAEIQGLTVSPQLKKVKGGKSKNEFILYLTPQELNKIEKTPIASQSLKNVRKWLLLGCNLGQRGQDLLNLTDDNFVTRHGLEVIELKQQKTGKQVTIPVLPVTKEILKEGLPYNISLQKFNSLLKDLCKEAGINEVIPGTKIEMVDKDGKVIPKDEKGKRKQKGEKRKVRGSFPKWQLMSSHVCRRSFATNTYGKLPTPLIMQITAHSTEKMFLGYIGKSSMDYAQQIADFYAKEIKKEISSSILPKTSKA
ncbi:phage integrase SAM-like domain-containing protein [Salinimicrobium sp. TH3]|uniref:phage integrase SAM-like domain-containing protein n=1 Tax=Salinimicrobium sp. TH3 TaxID=2997342 RepID=UPI0022759B82|nr:phage integrase SAM-like domain-containing protein [Salinimicrobium sp. TH3]MCY2685942.1 phage integrase SAM-like domain-containing protein [Salinimicrobium sp. TH3]